MRNKHPKNPDMGYPSQQQGRPSRGTVTLLSRRGVGATAPSFITCETPLNYDRPRPQTPSTFPPKSPPRETMVKNHAEKVPFADLGGYPPTPLPFFRSTWGSPTPPCAGPGGGYPLPPPAPGRANRHIPGKCRKTRFPAGDSTRNDGLGRAGKVPFAAKGGRGVIPLPPLHFFSKRGSPLHPCAGPGGGYPPPKILFLKAISRNKKMMNTQAPTMHKGS
jgi:hypothetical protein